MNRTSHGLYIRIRGIVQGVGFRPFVYNLANRYHLNGWVRNTTAGVEIEVCGDPQALQSFISDLQTQPPPLARIDSFEVDPRPANHWTSFQIIESRAETEEFLPVSPDVAICPECRQELFDPQNRRYRYPFINCTNCGPRFTIIRSIPYDRPNTTMAIFPLCPACSAEYHDPTNRRFHAQPIACPECGPHLQFLTPEGKLLAEREEALQLARTWLAEGRILAIKGLGGYHLACDATRPESVRELRRRKQRSDKPFALMAFDLSIITRHARVSEPEERLLTAPQHPIVLLDRLPTSSIAAEVAPGQRTLGFMLPYTPLHLLLLEPAPSFPEALVMTSGNLSEEPIAYRDEEALERLSSLADGFLMHNRPIHTRVDDSVVRVFNYRLYPLRRARGFAPDPIRLPCAVPPILATGGELKNTFCLTRGAYAFLSHHIGDLQNYETLQAFEESIDHYERLFRTQPEWLAADLHPDYLATRYAQERARTENIPLLLIQHHHAHLAACLADNGISDLEPAIGLIFDGTGYGTDGSVWGGEVLVGSYQGYQRYAHIMPVPLPGGDRAVHQVARMALAHLWACDLAWEDDLPPVKALCPEERTLLRSMLEKKINTPLTSSMGRLFDAVAALLGIRAEANYEAQAAMELENLADEGETGAYPLPFEAPHILLRPFWEALLHDLRQGTPLPTMAARFHNSIVNLCVEAAQHIRQAEGLGRVVLSGGVWQNQFLLRRATRALEQAGFQVLTHHQVPTNDGGLALGQVMVTASWIESNSRSKGL
ncbi:carbamoyltransferase HypF [uncultured Thermanaerothrix sp.]|uniref:carbamoyltransferase HypF n=1 Tax=uncultured Thermanaerothrix sp. TaxID=1195149 RepID=UPI00263245DF|nr:carbamoyltransferase HypF [uncultured Thermanaerothrix sp.]